MKKILLLLTAALLLSSCDLCGKDHEHKYSKRRRTVEPYYPVKICSLGDQTGESCVTIQAVKIVRDESYINLRDQNGDTYMYNNAGWSIIISPKVE